MLQVSTLQTLPENSPRVWVSVVVLVVALHACAGAIWMMQPKAPNIAVNEMTVFVAMRQAEVLTPQAEPAPEQPVQVKSQPKIARPVHTITQPVVHETAEAAPAVEELQPASVAPVAVTAPVEQAAAPVPDREPDYRAAYLSNPVPAYPMVARRMGWQGKVVLNVEVLASGLPGQIKLHQSSGREVLDNAAANTVKNWRFVPAQRAGRAVTQWFRVPINFSLEDNET